jgi:2-desacetyl-2-hydroxyethyl bacteriochlorophyllide A dehydrogenase
MPARVVSFRGPKEVVVVEESVPEPGPDEALVEVECSGISPGTELLLYRGQAPTDLPADETIPALDGGLEYPLRYGYAVVGRVREVGERVDADWLDRRVFAFHPHASHATLPADELRPVPEELSAAAATLLPNVEAAVNFAMDARPMIGERAVVFGQGVLGLLTTALLADHPLETLRTVDRYPLRRERSRALGADATFEPGEKPFGETPEGADLALELSGDPAALDAAIAATGYDGRVLVGSWYGNKPVELDLGGRFHRSRISVESSQVSTIDPRLRGRWGKDRRLDVAWDRLDDFDVDALLTHRLPVEEAPEAYRLLDERPNEAIGAVLSY